MRIRNSSYLLPGLRFTGEGDGAGGEGEPGGEGGSTYTPPATQADLDRIIQDRLARATAKYKDYDQIKAEADQLRALAATDLDKATAKAKADALAEAQAKAIPRVVRAEFKAAAKDAGLTNDQLDALLEDVDLTKYADADGEPDENKIARKIKAVAPQNGGTPPPKHRDLGQGNRSPAGAQPGDQGRAMAAKRFGTNTQAQSA
jgi:hypothetical protein